MAKLSEQQEKFCRHVVEGMNQGDAYREAGYKCANDNSAWANASALISNHKVAKRIAELRQIAAENAQIDAEWLLKEAVKSYQAARDDGAHSAANALLKTIGVYSGDWNEKSTRENINRDAEDFTEAELAAIARRSRTGASEQADSETQPNRLH